MNSLDILSQKLLQTRKYRALHLPPETIRDLIEQESQHYSDPKAVEESVRKKLHQLTALYLGDPDYEAALQEVRQLTTRAELEIFARRMLACHTSTRERLPNLTDFYTKLFAITGKPQCILDLACGLNPFALPMLELPPDIDYQAYDIHLPRVDLLNAFFKQCGFSAAHAEQRDILVDPPTQSAEVAFFFKEAHRMEQRQKGSNHRLWETLCVEYLLVSLPGSDIGKTHDMHERMRNLVKQTVQGHTWQIKEVECGDELVFCIHKGAQV
ncbi:MAG: hypothetical protein GYA18_11535 [Chloroflexi bacterium]|nr:hypothetical protein [Chloroflexota bacterium]